MEKSKGDSGRWSKDTSEWKKGELWYDMRREQEKCSRSRGLRTKGRKKWGAGKGGIAAQVDFIRLAVVFN